MDQSRQIICTEHTLQYLRAISGPPHGPGPDVPVLFLQTRLDAEPAKDDLLGQRRQLGDLRRCGLGRRAAGAAARGVRGIAAGLGAIALGPGGVLAVAGGEHVPALLARDGRQRRARHRRPGRSVRSACQAHERLTPARSETSRAERAPSTIAVRARLGLRRVCSTSRRSGGTCGIWPACSRACRASVTVVTPTRAARASMTSERNGLKIRTLTARSRARRGGRGRGRWTRSATSTGAMSPMRSSSRRTRATRSREQPAAAAMARSERAGSRVISPVTRSRDALPTGSPAGRQPGRALPRVSPPGAGPGGGAQDAELV